MNFLGVTGETRIHFHNEHYILTNNSHKQAEDTPQRYYIGICKLQTRAQPNAGKAIDLPWSEAGRNILGQPEGCPGRLWKCRNGWFRSFDLGFRMMFFHQLGYLV